MCSITGKHVHSVALDEAHEMLVNKDLKTIFHPSKEYLDRSMVLNAVKNTVMLDADGTKSGKIDVFDSSQLSAKVEENILCVTTKVQSSNTLNVHVFNQVRPLTSMSGQVATQTN